MPTDHYKPGPGTLTLGGTEFSMQLRNCRVEPTENVTEEEDLDLLDGTTLAGEDDVTRTYTLSGTAVQDLNDTGLLAYTWANAGDEVAFVFTPKTARTAAVSGTCRIVPLVIGGDANARAMADFSFACIGEPTLVPQDTTP